MKKNITSNIFLLNINKPNIKFSPEARDILSSHWFENASDDNAHDELKNDAKEGKMEEKVSPQSKTMNLELRLHMCQHSMVS